MGHLHLQFQHLLHCFLYTYTQPSSIQYQQKGLCIECHFWLVINPADSKQMDKVWFLDLIKKQVNSDDVVFSLNYHEILNLIHNLYQFLIFYVFQLDKCLTCFLEKQYINFTQDILSRKESLLSSVFFHLSEIIYCVQFRPHFIGLFGHAIAIEIFDIILMASNLCLGRELSEYNMCGQHDQFWVSTSYLSEKDGLLHIIQYR